MKFSEWIKLVPEEIGNDPLWRLEACRLSLFAADLAWHDSDRLNRDHRTIKLTSQLLGALGSIGANISEGYSRGCPKDRARFYEDALGSARESRTWYFDARHSLGETVAIHRIRFLTQIIRLLLTMLPATRGYSLHDGESACSLALIDDASSDPMPQSLDELLENPPMPMFADTEHEARNTITR